MDKANTSDKETSFFDLSIESHFVGVHGPYELHRKEKQIECTAFNTYIYIFLQQILSRDCLISHKNLSEFKRTKSKTLRAKNHISPEEPYFATFYYNGFQYSEAKFYHFFEAVDKNVLELIGNRRKKSVSVQNEEITGNSKYVAKYGHLAKYGSSLYM